MKLAEFIRKALSEDEEHPSSMRLMSFVGFVQWSLAITFGFIWVVVAEPTMIIGYLTTLAALAAGILGLKVWQRGKENEDKQ